MIADQSISDEGNVELSEQNDAGGEVDTPRGKVAGIGNCSKLKSSKDPRSSNGQRGLYPVSTDCSGYKGSGSPKLKAARSELGT